jgi:hypothetical protein
MKTTSNHLFLALALLALATFSSTVFAQGTAFTYQGRLNNSGNSANGNYNLTFTLFATNSTGVAIAGPVTNSAAVSNGLFTTTIDFGAGIFTGSTNLWLEIGVRTNGAVSFSTLAPRQQITPTPYAIYTQTAASLNNGMGNTLSDGASAIGGGRNNTSTGGTSVIGGGAHNFVSGATATIGGGESNTNTGYSSTIGGGINNTVVSGYATVGGGEGNTAYSRDTVVAGGQLNNAGSDFSAVVGGQNNYAHGAWSFVGGGSNNLSYNNYSTVSGGVGNNASGDYSFIGGGFNNVTIASYATIGGGLNNKATGLEAVVAGGWQNSATNGNDTVGGGDNNTASGGRSTIAGGTQSKASGYCSTIGGGYFNIANGDSSTIGGGVGNFIGGTNIIGDVNYAGRDSTIAGGAANTNIAYVGTVGGGILNRVTGDYATISGGQANIASGDDSAIPGGVLNVASGYSSFAAGNNARATNSGAFVWSDSTGTLTTSTNANSVTFRASGGYRLLTSTANVGVTLAANGTSWATISDRNAKKNFVPVNEANILGKLAAVPIDQWNYKWESDNTTPNIGPMAQDFIKAFYPGRDDKSITTLEFDGVELAAIKGLNQKLNDKDAEIQELKQSVAELKKQVQSLAEKK